MMNNKIISFLILVQIIVNQKAFGLNCQQCNTLTTSECLDTFAAEHSGECEETDNRCIKYKTVSLLADKGSMWGGKSEASAITRGCFATDENDGCFKEIIPDGYTITCICSGDNCNSGPIASSSPLMVLIGLTIGFIVLVGLAH